MYELTPAPNRDYLPIVEADKPREECGVLAFWDPNNETVLEDALQGLLELQHRGEEAAGLAGFSPSETGFVTWRGPGKVNVVFGTDGEQLMRFPADMRRGVGHTRYGTDSGEGDGNQPRQEEFLLGAHNGQLTNVEELATRHEITDYTTDSDLLFKIINKVAARYNGDVERATRLVLPELQGAFSLVILTQDKLIAARDHNGIRPLHLGRTETGGYVVASERPAVEKMNATPDREVGPGEMVVIGDRGMSYGQWTEADPSACAFEFVYLSNKRNVINGRNVQEARRESGARMAPLVMDMIKQKGGIVVPIPNTANQSAQGFAEATGLPYVAALTKNEDVAFADLGRSFIQPDDAARILVADGKTVLTRDMVEGEVVWVVDDSVVRGHTSKVKAKAMYEAGAKEVHMIITSPEYADGCELGVDTGNKEELLTVRMDHDVEKMRRYLEVDSLTFLPLEELRKAIGVKICDFCIGGEKPNLVSKQNNELFTLPKQSDESNAPELAVA